MGRSRCAGLDFTELFAKNEEKWRGKEEVGQKGAWKQACGEGEISNL